MATVQKVDRQKRALKMLETTLKSGLQSEKINGKTTGNKIPQTESDVKRLKNEISTLKEKLKI